ncbi:exonuclease [Aeromonas phage phiA014S]|uniref:Exonuclease n=1 Tax=Aeromonas phage phiA014S TaxID=3119845 RepID=A0ABZ2CN18_9CAUD
MTKHALILDADYLVFSAMSAAEQEIDWGDDIWTLECDHGRAWDILCRSIEAIVEKRAKWKGSKLVMCFTDAHNWRKDILPTYKMNRKGKRKPTGYHAFVERVMANPEWNSFLRPTLEGDDCMGILGTNPKLVGCDSATLVSCDKDFKTIPCEFYWLTTGEILNIDEAEADYWHMYQTLIGDTTDGYGGIKGVGETAAVDFLANPYKFEQVEKVFKSGPRKGQSVFEWKKVDKEESDSLWTCMVSLAEKNGMTEDELLVQARVARICRMSDFNLHTKEVILWEPNRDFA